MPHSFPRDLVPLLRCEHDGGRLSPVAERRADDRGIVDGALECEACRARIPVEGGIVRSLDSALPGEDELERTIRDTQLAQRALAPARSRAAPSLADLLEVGPTLRALAPDDRTVLEIGCGDGRLTVPVAASGARVLAVDFSINSLAALAARLSSPGGPEDPDTGPRVGLVHADANRLRVASASFDRAVSTTSLDTPGQRMSLYARIADALTDDGRYVGSVEHDDLGRRLLGLPLVRRYPSGIRVEHFPVATVRREAGPFFGSLGFSTLRPRIPFLSRVGDRTAVAVARMVVALPLLGELGELLLVRADRPVRGPVEGTRRPGSALAQRCFRGYARMLGKEPLWERNERV